MAIIALAGLDPLPVMRSRDMTLVRGMQAVAHRVLALRIDGEARRDRNLAVRIVNAMNGKAD